MPQFSRRFVAVSCTVLIALYVSRAGGVDGGPGGGAGGTVTTAEPPARLDPPAAAGAGPGAGAAGPGGDAGGDGKATEDQGASDQGVMGREGLAEAADRVRVLAGLDIDAGQQPEGIAAEPVGSTVVTFAHTRQIARISPGGKVRVLATLPAPPPSAETPTVGEPFLGGIVRAGDGTLYVTYGTGTAELTGVWRLSPDGGGIRRIAALPADGLPNGIALDSRAGQLYVTDSVAGVVLRLPRDGGRAVVWSSDPLLAPDPGGFAGANGIRVHRGAVWVTNHDRGTVLRFPVTGSPASPTAGRPGTVAEGLGEIDDLEFTGDGDTLLVTGVTDSRVLLIRDGTGEGGGDRNGGGGGGSAGRAAVAVLDEDDGLRNPSALARHGARVWIANSAHYTLAEPRVLVMPVPR
ncbi:hypothetical protein AB0G74_05975 [Streptomyces sp. NPDC020875]|uniref:SMP-30/gluconolactonase/LRE family protein n=1 Tax=Streptomyces sp. NPDC020875 TaxID=3154898 RepID=UPI00340E9F33